ncbi:16S rRNA (guanine(527)-N(7))-methyltransferase RsmG [Aeromicrobium sp. YIM 150415]|uniref:16S rRNA (guanine(527)-N(7))-methyltransferase RsmG n=1 Tax=Aeromicrobium sp. YIM 150415 TaxID=2803912 RepID=UPI001963F651|nr:16S rRNA (guanine(527)-N(7))-methyltransferase RsmG [Aeromicrobium sp. YIM 150415]MBM9463859.1 16S rRNA (guanine(527)-N(7))-methyltransferase RsmG [Aeromicrobium sp. YIM 150415]
MTDSVSRETTLDRYFGARRPLIEAYAQFLETAGVERGMIGPREAPRLWDRHLLNCVVVTPRIPDGSRVADVGSGAGLPGLVWAIARPDIEMTLIEPLLRRTRFLDEAVERLGLSNVVIDRRRAEDVDLRFDVVTARAVAALGKLGRWCLPLVAPGGALLAMKGSSASDELEAARADLVRLGARTMVVETYGDDVLEVPTTVVEVTR